MSTKFQKVTLATEIIGAIAIVVSMVYVGIQFKENTKATKSATANATIGAMSGWYADMGMDREASEMFWNFMADPQSLSETERFQMIMNMHAIFLTFQNSYYLAEEGTLDQRLHLSLTETINGVRDQPGFYVFWEIRKSIFFEEFRAYVEEVVSSDHRISPGLYSDQTATDLNLPDPLEAGWEGESVCEVVSENDHVRVLKCVFPPGVGHERHYHNPHTGYTLVGGKFQITDSTGTRVVDVPSGSSFGKDQLSVHEVLNVGETTGEFLIIEHRQ